MPMPYHRVFISEYMAAAADPDYRWDSSSPTGSSPSASRPGAWPAEAEAASRPEAEPDPEPSQPQQGQPQPDAIPPRPSRPVPSRPVPDQTGANTYANIPVAGLPVLDEGLNGWRWFPDTYGWRWFPDTYANTNANMPASSPPLAGDECTPWWDNFPTNTNTDTDAAAQSGAASSEESGALNDYLKERGWQQPPFDVSQKQQKQPKQLKVEPPNQDVRARGFCKPRNWSCRRFNGRTCQEYTNEANTEACSDLD